MYGISSEGREFLYDENLWPEITVSYKGKKILADDEFAINDINKIREIYKKNGRDFDEELKLLQSEFISHCHIEQDKLLVYSSDFSDLPNIRLAAPAKKIGDYVRVTVHGGYFEKEHQLFEMTCNNDTKDYTVTHWDLSEDENLELENYTTKNPYLAARILCALTTSPNDSNQEFDVYDLDDYIDAIYHDATCLKQYNSSREDELNATLWSMGILPLKKETSEHVDYSYSPKDFSSIYEKVQNTYFDINENLFTKQSLSKDTKVYFSPLLYPFGGDIKNFEQFDRINCDRWQVNLLQSTRSLYKSTSDNVFLAARSFVEQINADTDTAKEIANKIGNVLYHAAKEMNLMNDVNITHISTFFGPQLEEAREISPKKYTNFFNKIYETALMATRTPEKTNTNDFRRD